MLLRKFDPWNSSLCTCPGKLSLNPYTGCAHGCLYCYASSYIPRFSDCRPKIGLQERLRREVRRIEQGALVSVANSSDPYPAMERNLHLTRACIKILRDSGLRLQLVTKSDIVARDIDLLGAMSCVVINESEIEDLVSAVCKAGALHITSSTYKARPDSWKRLKEAFPDESNALYSMFEKGDWTSGYHYLPNKVRLELMQKIKEAATERGATFSTCREGFPSDVGISCDGSHLTEKKQRPEVSLKTAQT